MVQATIEFPLWWQQAAVHQDFIWFAAVVAWSAVLILWRRLPEGRAGWRWVPAAALAGLLTALAPFLVYSPPFDFFQARLRPGTVNDYRPAWIEVELAADFLQTLGWAALAAVWGWGGLTARGEKGRALRWAAPGLAAAVAGWHFQDPAAAAWPLALLVGAAGGLQATTDGCRGRGWLAVAASGAMWSVVGPAALRAGALQRDVPASAWGLGVALGQTGLATALVVAFFPEAWWRGATAQDRREWRWCLAGAAVWLVSGIGFAWLTGQDNREELHNNRLRTVAAEARLFGAERLRGLAGEGLSFERWQSEEGDEATGLMISRNLQGPEAAALRAELGRLVQRTPFLDEVRIVVQRDGWLVAIASSRPPLAPGVVTLLRELTAEDIVREAEGRPYVEPPLVATVGAPYYCRAPIMGENGEVLAWLEYTRAEFFQSLARKWRAGPLLITALGLVIGALGVAQRRVAREREEATRARLVAEEANRWQMLFLAKVSHELRTPLQGVLGYGELLVRDAADAPTRARAAAVREHGEMMLRLVNDLLDLGSLRHGGVALRREAFEVEREVRAAIEVFREPAAAKELTLDFVVAAGVPEVIRSDATRWRQIVFNLVGNAVKYTDAGAVTVTLAPDDMTGGIRLTVTDTGPGIAAADRVRLFQPFSRLDETAHKAGSGLGLALVAAIVEAMRGTITESGRVGGGACFTVRLPAEPAALSNEVPAVAHVQGEAGARATMGSGGALAGRRVLIADDNPWVREFFVSVLVEQGAVCDAVADGLSAWQRLDEGRHDVLVADMNMPGLSGWELVGRLRDPDGEGRKALRIVGVSAQVDPGAEQRAADLGMDAFLSKPIDVGALVAAVGGRAATASGERAPSPRSTHENRPLEQLFRDDLGGQMRGLEDAVAARRCDEVVRRAHYLRNSAMVVADAELGVACRELEEAARGREETAELESAWRKTKTAARRWQAAV